MKSMKEFIKQKKKLIIGIGLYVIFLLMMNINYFTKLIRDNNPPTRWVVIFIILSCFISIAIGGLIIFINKKKDIKPEKLFVVSAIILSTTYMFATPLFKGHDEQYQWYRAYEVSIRKFSTIVVDNIVGNYLPAEVGNIYAHDGNFTEITYRTAVATWKYSLESRNEESLKQDSFIETSPTAAYSPLQMLPQSIGVTIARFITLDIYSQGMVGRLFNVIFFILCGYFSIKFIPNKKYLILCILLCPKVLYISSTLSSDNVINMTILLFLTYILKLRSEKQKVNIKKLILPLILVPFIAASKFVYIPICALLLLIPNECFKNKKYKMIFIILAVIVALSSFMIWKNISNAHFGISDAQTESQIGYLIHHPLSYIGLLVRSVSNNFSYWALDTVGGYMEWGTALVNPEIVSVIIYLVLFLCIMQEENNNEFKFWEKSLIVGIVLSVVAAIITAMYNACVKDIGSTNIAGVQGKYFVPILSLIFLIIPTKYIKSKNKLEIKYIYIIMLLCQIPSLLNIFIRNIR